MKFICFPLKRELPLSPGPERLAFFLGPSNLGVIIPLGNWEFPRAQIPFLFKRALKVLHRGDFLPFSKHFFLGSKFPDPQKFFFRQEERSLFLFPQARGFLTRLFCWVSPGVLVRFEGSFFSCRAFFEILGSPRVPQGGGKSGGLLCHQSVEALWPASISVFFLLYSSSWPAPQEISDFCGGKRVPSV